MIIFIINITSNTLYFYFSLVILYFLLLYYKLIVNNHVTFIIDDVIELYVMQKELDIYKYYLIEKVIILLYMTFLNTVYPLIHTLMTLRIAITCIIHKILYSSDSENSKHSFNKIVITVLTLKNS